MKIYIKFKKILTNNFTNGRIYITKRVSMIMFEISKTLFALTVCFLLLINKKKHKEH